MKTSCLLVLIITLPNPAIAEDGALIDNAVVDDAAIVGAFQTMVRTAVQSA